MQEVEQALVAERSYLAQVVEMTCLILVVVCLVLVVVHRLGLMVESMVAGRKH